MWIFTDILLERNDQSSTERVMISRIDQQIYVNKLMIDAYCLPQDVSNKHLARYMLSYLAMICCVTSIMLLISGTPENLEKRRELWQYFKKKYRACTGEFALAAVVLSAIHRARFPMELLYDATEWLRRFTSLIKRNARCFGNMSWGNDNALSELWPAPRR